MALCGMLLTRPKRQLVTQAKSWMQQIFFENSKYFSHSSSEFLQPCIARNRNADVAQEFDAVDNLFVNSGRRVAIHQAARQRAVAESGF
ncbi:hypothetical protein WR25_16442 [Diploscapter pachys]|uniref:Uncharacterized protein n=1 Tax=Diploscapter pachys TaxID=2018661 RepID=A0A2A2LEA0_9BILA|nr:hypothetical protein WR25_16442 [Diploscapter pachys]